MKKYTYLLCDDGGVSNAEDQELLLQVGTVFRHAFGLYEVKDYRDDEGNSVTKLSQIINVNCERISK